MEIIRNLTRRKLRNFLTISGIVIGVLALVTMGSMAEKFNALLAGGATYFSSNVQVADESSSSQGFGGALMPLNKVTEIEQVSGVAIAFAEIGVSAKPGGNAGVSFGIPDYISSSDPKANDYSKFKVSLARGRDITNASQGEVVLGADFASEFKKKVGDALDLPIRPTDARPDFVNHTFTVVGILNKTRPRRTAGRSSASPTPSSCSRTACRPPSAARWTPASWPPGSPSTGIPASTSTSSPTGSTGRSRG
ncbi:MAG TPA: ABC transporter permease [Candidatus Limnocylindria bacterium]|nr:ABC transporter permease [Candidatus Limnocylindria bacterium]